MPFNAHIATLFVLKASSGARYLYSAVGKERNKISIIPGIVANRQNCEILPSVFNPFKDK